METSFGRVKPQYTPHVTLLYDESGVEEHAQPGRIEKGHVAGNEINGQLTARDLGLGRMMSKKKDYIGRVMAQRAAPLEPDRPAQTWRICGR